MTEQQLRSVVVVGGGVAAWIAAAALARALSVPRQRIVVQVIEPSSVLPHEAVLEAGGSSLPSMRVLHRILGIDERDFMRRTAATFKLGTLLKDWERPCASHFHPFGETGGAFDSVAFHHHWLRLCEELGTDLTDYSLAAVAAHLGRFAHPATDPRSVGATLDYGYHFDCESYRLFLRAHARTLGVECLTGNVLAVIRRAEDGWIEALRLDGERRVVGDLYIDTSGSLLERDFKSWSRWLPCDRVALSSSAVAETPPYTEIAARSVSAGWQWHVPLRDRVSHGYVYSSALLHDEPQGQVVRFENGRRKQFWVQNGVAIGAAACFVEPLAATPIHVIHSGVAKLLALFPYRDRMAPERDEYNRLMGSELERIRDFSILHYSSRTQDLPDTLARKIRLFTHRGRVVLDDDEVFSESSWACLFTALGFRPRSQDALAATPEPERVKANLERMRTIILRAAQDMPSHRAYLERYA